MASLRSAARLTKNARSLLSRVAAYELPAAAGTAARTLPAALRTFSAAAEPAKAPIIENDMFCYQCEQTKSGTGCTTVGVCGKTPETAYLQDLLTYSIKGLACWTDFAAKQGVEVPAEVYSFLHAATFATLTNVNFDDARFKEYVNQCHELRDGIEALVRAKGVEASPVTPSNLPWFDLLAHPAAWKLNAGYLQGASKEQLVNLGKMTSLEHRRHVVDPTLLGLHEMITYGLRGLCAYTHHAEVLGQRDADVDKFVAEAYAFLCSEDALDLGKVLGMVDACGAAGLKAMKILDEGHVSKFGHPEPTQVRITPKKGKAILISGHDMQDTHDLLVQTEGKGVNVWTHGELLPAHGYPALKKRFPHLVGNYGGAWYRQQKEFSEFPGAILMTTNCIIEPRQSYKDRIFTTGEVGWSGVSHIEGKIGQTKDYSAVINKALEMPGFTEEPAESEAKFVTTGFARNAVLSVAGDVVKAVQDGHLKHIFLIGGCDGSEPDRKYFGKVADATPQDTMLLTLGCGKFRFYDHDYGMLPNTGLPRLIDRPSVAAELIGGGAAEPTAAVEEPTAVEEQPAAAPEATEEPAAVEEHTAVEEDPSAAPEATGEPAAVEEPAAEAAAEESVAAERSVEEETAAGQPAPDAAAAEATASPAAEETPAPCKESAPEQPDSAAAAPAAEELAAPPASSSVADEGEAEVGEQSQEVASPAAQLAAEPELQQEQMGAASGANSASLEDGSPLTSADGQAGDAVDVAAADVAEPASAAVPVETVEAGAIVEPEAEAAEETAQLAEAGEQPEGDAAEMEGAASGAVEAAAEEPQPPADVEPEAAQQAEGGEGEGPSAAAEAAGAEVQLAPPVVEVEEQGPPEAEGAALEAEAEVQQQMVEEAEAALPVPEAHQADLEPAPEAEAEQEALEPAAETEAEQEAGGMAQVAAPAEELPHEPLEQPGTEATLAAQQEGQGGGSAVGQTTSAYMEGGLVAISEESYSQLLQREVSAKLMQVLSEQQLAGAAAEEEPDQEGEEPGSAALPAGQSSPGAGMAGAPAALVLPAGSPLVAAGGAEPAGFDEPLLKWSPVGKKGSPGRRVLPAAAAPRGDGQLGSPPARSPTHSRRMAPLPGPPGPTAAPGSRPEAASAGRPKPGSHMAPLSRTAPEAAGPSTEAANRLRRLSKPSMSEILAAAGAKPRPAKPAGSKGGSLAASRGGSASWAPTHLMTAPPPVAPNQPPMQLPGAGLPPAAFPSMPPGAGPAASGALLNWGRPSMAAPPVAAPGGWFVPAPAGFGAVSSQFVPPPAAYTPTGLQPEQLAVVADGDMLAGESAPPASSGGVPAEPGQREAPADTADLPAQAGASSAPSASPGPGVLDSSMDGPAVDEEHAHPYAPYAAATAAGPQQDVNVAASWPPYEGAKLPPLYEEQLVGGAGLIPAVHSAASFSVAPGRRGYPAPGSAGTPTWRASALPAQQMYMQPQGQPGGYFMPAPQQVPGAWAGQPMAVPPQWGMPAGGPAMRYAAQPPQAPGAMRQAGPGQQGMPMYQAQELTAEQQQAMYYQQLQAQQQQAYMWQVQQQQALYYQQAQLAARAQEAGQGLHADEPLFAREPMPQVPVALDPSGRPFKVFHGVAARSIRKPDRYQPDGRPAWSR